MVKIGSRIVFLSTTSIGKIPYIRIGASFTVDACGFNNVMLMYTFGAISAVTGISTLVSPFWVSAQSVFTTLVPFSKESKARLPKLEGKETIAFSPTAYFSLSEVNTSMFADEASPFLVLPDQ